MTQRKTTKYTKLNVYGKDLYFKNSRILKLGSRERELAEKALDKKLSISDTTTTTNSNSLKKKICQQQPKNQKQQQQQKQKRRSLSKN